jgi:hypothetical protein
MVNELKDSWCEGMGGIKHHPMKFLASPLAYTTNLQVGGEKIVNFVHHPNKTCAKFFRRDEPVFLTNKWKQEGIRNYAV